MPISATIAAVYNPLKDIWLYIKSRRRHVIDLDRNFEMLSSKYRILLNYKKHIENKFALRKKNDNYRELEGQIDQIKRKYERLESKFKKSGGCEHSPTNENVANGGEGSTSSAQVAPNQHIDQRKIWTKKFWSNARLDKDVLKLIKEIDMVKIGDVKPETLETNYTQVQWKDAPKRDHMPQWRYVKKLLEYLETASTKRIGIHGEPQVGKSTVLKTVGREQQSYVVIWVNFPSKDSGDVIENMQKQILESIYGREEQSFVHNATKIYNELMEVKYLLILDDVYKGINLADLGIHDDHKLGKIVIGATGKGVLNHMKVDEIILIEKLEYDAAEKFFKECLGLESSVDLSSVQPYIKKIIELIGGHIGALVGIAGYMKRLGTDNIDLNAWEAVVHDLQLPNSPQKLELGALEKSYKFPYDGLEDKNLKKCLLYIALFPVGYRARKSYLVECWKAEDFMEDYHTFMEARKIGHNICLQLTQTNLLEWSGYEYLKMPLLFRKVALQIQYPDDEGEHKLLVRNILERCNHPCEQDWDIAKRISLMCGELDSDFLPNCPMCNNTLTLLLQANPKLRDIRNPFFLNMGNLRVLDLQHTGINGLPKSVTKLGHLKCLFLNDCSSLKNLPTEMKKLKQLELLDIRRTSMDCLPCEIWYLESLRCLRISVCNSRESKGIVMHSQQPCFSRKFLKLRFLEELTVHVDPQIPDKRLIVEQIKEVLKEAEHYLKVTWELEEFIASTGSQSNGQDITLPHSSSPITENGITEMQPTTINKLKNVTQLEITEASTSTANSQHTESTKEWVQEKFQHK